MLHTASNWSAWLLSQWEASSKDDAQKSLQTVCWRQADYGHGLLEPCPVETKINLFGSDAINRVWRQPGEEHKDKCVLPTFLQCCPMKRYNKFAEMWGVYSLLWDTLYLWIKSCNNRYNYSIKPKASNRLSVSMCVLHYIRIVVLNSFEMKMCQSNINILFLFKSRTRLRGARGLSSQGWYDIRVASPATTQQRNKMSHSSDYAFSSSTDDQKKKSQTGLTSHKSLLAAIWPLQWWRRRFTSDLTEVKQ